MIFFYLLQRLWMILFMFLRLCQVEDRLRLSLLNWFLLRLLTLYGKKGIGDFSRVRNAWLNKLLS